MATIVLLDDDPRDQALMHALCRARGWTMLIADRMDAVLTLITQHAVQVVILDGSLITAARGGALAAAARRGAAALVVWSYAPPVTAPPWWDAWLLKPTDADPTWIETTGGIIQRLLDARRRAP